ncbi:hypothetical protein NHH03_20890 [Stieleria sp. TO1_6]|uniref:hypothetical protein n=1 Tax=Stieleria tagensis TaxID=2956795 RepID=UPI00209B0AE5|nr:hypothetical protein [Stieleria tagensis]MCO8124213.1 hypothetical protein [Stieleria tagensis]
MKRLLTTAFASLIIVHCTMGQEPTETAAAPDPKSDRLFDRFDETARSLEMATAADDKKFVASESPLFRFSSEGTVFGGVYLWKDASKRMAVIGTIGSIPINGNDVEFVELHLLKPQRLKPVTLMGGKRWDPDVTPLQFRDLPQSPKVAESASSRLVQLRAIARQFSADMIEGEQTNSLRLLPQPLFRYPDSTKQHDGALFAFVWDKGTDPELILRIESTEDDGQLVWKYQPIRFTWRELKLRHSGDDVWSVDEFLERNNAQQITPYLTGLTQVIP